MDKRAFTVGSLIPGMVIPKQASTPNPSTLQSGHANKIIVLQNEQRFEIEPVKGKLLDAALNQGKTLQYKCRKGTCGLCAVKIVEDSSGLSVPNEQEQKKLMKSLNDGFRLACQAEIL